MTTQRAAPTGEISGETAKAKTGKDWDEWFVLLDGEGAQALSHRDIARIVNEKYGIPGWWAQSVAVYYDRARGMRDNYQAPGGYQASASKTVNVPLPELFGAWADDDARSRWLPSPSR